MVDEKEKNLIPTEVEDETEDETLFGLGNLNERAEKIEEQTGGNLLKNVGCGG